MDFIKQLGPLALAIRLRRISDQMVRGGHQLYQGLEVDVEPNWYFIFLLLKEKSPQSITEMAEALGLAHPSVHAIVQKILEKGYLQEIKDPQDGRRRLVRLSRKGHHLLKKMEPIWNAATAGIQKMLEEVSPEFLDTLEALESQLHDKGFDQRTLEQLSH